MGLELLFAICQVTVVRRAQNTRFSKLTNSNGDSDDKVSSKSNETIQRYLRLQTRR